MIKRFVVGTVVGALWLVGGGPSQAEACDLALWPNNVRTLTGTPGEIGEASGSPSADAQAPAVPVLSDLELTLYRTPCRGEGSACPQPDSLQVKVSVSDDVTPLARMRYVAFFADTAAGVSAATHPEILFDADGTDPALIRAFLGIARERSGSGFGRQDLCFAIAAVDEKGNVGGRSAPQCLDTTDEAGAGVTLEQGGCRQPGGMGCSNTSDVASPVFVGLLALAAWGGRRGGWVRRYALGRHKAP